MKIGVISDTHGVVAAWDKALPFFDGCELIIHAGDVLYHPPRLQEIPGYRLVEFAERLNGCPIPLVIARGNCDCEVYEELLRTPVQAPYAVVDRDGVRIVVNHGHLMDRRAMIAAAQRFRAHIFISGHTHVPVLEKVEDVVLLNPGSAAIPKFEKNGRPVPSVAVIQRNRISIVSTDDGSRLFELEDWI